MYMLHPFLLALAFRFSWQLYFCSCHKGLFWFPVIYLCCYHFPVIYLCCYHFCVFFLFISLAFLLGFLATSLQTSKVLIFQSWSKMTNLGVCTNTEWNNNHGNLYDLIVGNLEWQQFKFTWGPFTLAKISRLRVG